MPKSAAGGAMPTGAMPTGATDTAAQGGEMLVAATSSLGNGVTRNIASSFIAAKGAAASSLSLQRSSFE